MPLVDRVRAVGFGVRGHAIGTEPDTERCPNVAGGGRIPNGNVEPQPVFGPVADFFTGRERHTGRPSE